MTTILFGSIGSLADTSELQRAAFNAAFDEHGLGWEWSQPEYRVLLRGSGGEQRIADYARGRDEDVDAAAVHATKSRIFQERLRGGGISPRPGVVETIESAERDGAGVALVTTTSAENIAALGEALRPAVDLDGFALVLDTSDVEAAKPAPDVYALALDRLGEDAGAVVAIEDNPGGAAAAAAAGITCVAFPSENNADNAFDEVSARVDTLDYDELSALVAA